MSVPFSAQATPNPPHKITNEARTVLISHSHLDVSETKSWILHDSTSQSHDAELPPKAFLAIAA
jgi:hypothetical protein